jgi:uncharacterized repeat protein (TIGR02543 family)
LAALSTEPTRQGYDFSGWNTAAAGTGTAFLANTPVTASITVFAQWTALPAGTHRVTFDKNGGDTEADPVYIDVVEPATTIAPGALPTPPTWTEGTFDSWNTLANGTGTTFDANTTVNANITVFAKWTVLQAGQVLVRFFAAEGDATPLKSVTIEEGDRVATADFPPATAIPNFTIVSWKKADGSAFTETTNVNENTDVFVNVKTVIRGTPTVVGNTVEHAYPLMSSSNASAHGGWAGSINDDGTIVWTGGAFRYLYATIEPTAQVSDYDFVTVDFVASGALDTPGSSANIVYKYYADGTDYTHTGGINSASGSITFPITTTGFAIQKWGSAAEETTITITKITFTKATRYHVTFSLGTLNGTAYAGDDDLPDPRDLTEGVAFGALPAVSWAPNRFAGWTLNDVPVLSSTIVDSSFADGVITAQWKPPKTVAPLELKFTDDPEANLEFTLGTGGANNTTVSSLRFETVQGTGGAVIAFTNGTGYRAKLTSSGYEYGYAVMTINFGAETVGDDNVIGDYDKVTFTLNGIRGDTGWKPVRLVANDPLSGKLGDAGAPKINVEDGNYNQATGTKEIVLDINKGAVSTLTSSTIEVGIWFHANGDGSQGTELQPGDPTATPPVPDGDELGGPSWGTSGKPTTFEITNVVFSQNPPATGGGDDGDDE